MEGVGNIHVRPASLADYQSVMAISGDIFRGFDYLCCHYKPLLQTRKANFFVAEVDGKIVGFKNYLITDGGKTAISQGTRIHPSYRGQGIHAELSRQGQRILQRRVTGLQRVRFAALLPDAHHKKLMDDPENLQTILQIENVSAHVGYWSSFKSAAPLVRKYLPDSKHTRVLSPDEANASLSYKGINRLFEKGLLTCYTSEPHEFTQDNWRHICANHRVIASVSKSTGALVALSLSTACQTSQAARHDVFFYGEDTNLLMSHVAMNICQLPECSDATKRLGFLVHYPAHMERGMVSRWMTELVGPSLCLPFGREDRVYIAEMVFPPSAPRL